MANNNINLSIGVEQRGLLSAIKSTETLERNIKKLSDSYARGSASYGRYNTAIGNLAKAAGKSKSELLSYGKAIRASEKAIRDSQKATKKASLEIKAYALARRQAAEEDARRTAEQKKETLATERQVQALHKLNLKYKEGYAAADIMAREVKELERALEAGIIDTNKMTAAKAQLNAQMKAGTGYFANAATGMQVVGKRANRLGVITQQAGYQFGDFAVQVQSGTSPLIAFSQQATQLIGTFSMLATSTRAIMAFSALGVVVPVISAVAGAFLRTREAASGSALAVKAFEERLKTAKKETREMTESLRLLRSGFEEESQLALYDVIVKERKDLKQAQQRLAQSTGDFLEKSSLRDDVNAAKESLRLAVQALKAHENINVALDRERSLRERNKSVTQQLHLVRQQMQKDRREAVNLYREEGRSLNNQILLTNTALTHGKDSVQVKNQERQVELDNYALRLKSSKLDPTFIADLRNKLSLQLTLNQQLEDQEAAAKAVEEAFKKTQASLKTLVGQSSNLDVEIAKAKAQIEALKNNTDVATAAYIAGEEAKITATYETTKALAIQNGNMIVLAENALAYAEAMEKLETLKGLKTTLSGMKGDAKASKSNPLLDLQKRIALDTKLLGVSREQAQVERAIANSKIKYSDQEIANTVKELEVYNLKLARIKETQALYGTVQSSLESGFMAMVDGTKSVEDAFKDMAKSVIAELYRVLVVKRMVGSFEAGTGIMGFLGGIFGKASGGTVMSGTPYLVGEKGPELIVPQNRGHVMNADLTAKAMNGSKGETVVVNQTINVSTGVQQTVRSEIKQLMPQIAQSAKSAVVDAKRRGGSYGRAFS